VQAPNFFATMIDAVQSPSSTGLTWCNDTPHKIMAAVGTDDGKTVTSRGWYRIDPGKCLHPDVTGQPKQIFSFAEAVDAENRTIKFKDKPLNWGGATQLCTRESKFEINEQGDCGTRGLAHRLCARLLPPSTCPAAARRCALRCRDEEKAPRTFTHIDTWVFDLDNTLYPHHVNLWQQVDARIGEFVSAISRCPRTKRAGSRRIITAATAPPCAA
jgi:uncharacterized membrane protein